MEKMSTSSIQKDISGSSLHGRIILKNMLGKPVVVTVGRAVYLRLKMIVSIFRQISLSPIDSQLFYETPFCPALSL